MSKITVRAPATTANIGGGFDCLGMALGLFMTVTTELSDRLIVDGVEGDSNNLVYRAMNAVFELCGKKGPVEITINSNIPRTSGMGSSAACIVAGAIAADRLTGAKLPLATLIDICARLDGHPDNILPALVGGVTAGYVTDDGKIGYIRADAPQGLVIAVATPDFPLSTAKARAVLPDKYTRADCVYSLSRAVVTFGALAQGRIDMLGAVGDKLHQPYRIPLIKGFDGVTSAFNVSGAIGSCISGAGPSVIGFFDDEKKARQIKLDEHWTLRILKPCNAGAQIADDEK